MGIASSNGVVAFDAGMRDALSIFCESVPVLSEVLILSGTLGTSSPSGLPACREEEFTLGIFRRASDIARE